MFSLHHLPPPHRIRRHLQQTKSFQCNLEEEGKRTTATISAEYNGIGLSEEEEFCTAATFQVDGSLINDSQQVGAEVLPFIQRDTDSPDIEYSLLRGIRRHEPMAERTRSRRHVRM